MNVPATFSIRVVASDVQCDGGRFGFGALLEGHGTLNVGGVSTNYGDYNLNSLSVMLPIHRVCHHLVPYWQKLYLEVWNQAWNGVAGTACPSAFSNIEWLSN